MCRMLILSCSSRKKLTKEYLPAIEQYDGPAFRVLRKYLRERRGPLPRILILSGNYGLIDPNTPICEYDCRMTTPRAEELRPEVLERLGNILRNSPIRSVGLCLSRDYRQAVDGLESRLPEGTTVEAIGGGLGRRLTRLREWLYRDVPGGDDTVAERGRKRRANDPA